MIKSFIHEIKNNLNMKYLNAIKIYFSDKIIQKKSFSRMEKKGSLIKIILMIKEKIRKNLIKEEFFLFKFIIS